MAFLGQEFKQADMPQGNNYEPLPAGWYTATIAEADIKPTNDGTGEYIKLRYDITGPTHQGRVVFSNLNIKNKSVKAEEIGRQQFCEVMRAIGLASVKDTDQLIGGQLSIKLDIRDAHTDTTTGKTYDARNEVKGFKSLYGDSPLAASQASASSPANAPSATAGKAAPPWAKK